MGRRFMADQVIGHLQDMAAYVLKTYLDVPQAPHPEVLNEVLRQPIFQGNHAEKPETCILDDQFRALVVGGHVRPQPDTQAQLPCCTCCIACVSGRTQCMLQPAPSCGPVAATRKCFCVILLQGWHWINEGKLANKPKWGFVSTTLGSQLVLKVQPLLLSPASCKQVAGFA